MIYIQNIYDRILLRHKKNEILPFATMWIDLDSMQSEISHIESDNHTVFTYM